MAGSASSVVQVTRLALTLVAAASLPLQAAAAQDVAGGGEQHVIVLTLRPTEGASHGNGVVGPDELATFFVYPNTETMVDAAVEVDTDCQLVSSGTWKITAQPKYGTTTLETVPLPVQSGSCAGKTLPFATVSYTWTSTK